MIMKMPTNSVGGGGTGNGGSTYGDGGGYDLDADDYDSPVDVDAFLDDDFSEYLWMENEEEFDKEEMLRLEEEALMEECIEAMLDEQELLHEEGGERPDGGAAQEEQPAAWSNITE